MNKNYLNQLTILGLVASTFLVGANYNSIFPAKVCIPAFLDGGGPYYKENAPFRQSLSPDENNGQKLIVSGKLLLSDCKSVVKNAILDIWQANESGNYEGEWYRGRVNVDEDGFYKFETVIPKGYGEGTGYRPPHIHFKVWKDNKLIITSQMFLPEASNQKIEKVYIIETKKKGDFFYGKHNIILPLTSL